jgi:hypothetical protein
MARRRRARTGGVASLWTLQQQAARLGVSWLETSMGAAQVIATRTVMMGAAMAQPVKLADPEFTLMVTEKAAAVGEAAERLSRHAVRRAGRRGSASATDLAADTVGAAAALLTPFHRRVRANVRRLKKPGA